MHVIVGLCAVCANARLIENRRGSTFWLCELSRVDARFARYPQLPVLECSGWMEGTPQRAAEPRDASGEAGSS